MKTHHWPTVKKRLKKTIDQGIKILKEGGEEAKHIANQTAHFLELELDAHKLKSRIHKINYELGLSVSKSLENGRFHMSPRLKKLSTELANLKKSLKKREGQLHRLKFTTKK